MPSIVKRSTATITSKARVQTTRTLYLISRRMKIYLKILDSPYDRLLRVFSHNLKSLSGRGNIDKWGKMWDKMKNLKRRSHKFEKIRMLANMRDINGFWCNYEQWYGDCNIFWTKPNRGGPKLSIYMEAQ